MSQVENLIQMIWNRATPAAKPGQTDAKSAGSGSSPAHELMPIDTSMAGTAKTGASSANSFQAKIRESHAKLAAKKSPAQAPKPAPQQNKNDASRNDAVAAKAQQFERANADQADRKDKNDRADKADRADQADRDADGNQADRTERSDKSRKQDKPEHARAAKRKDKGEDADPQADAGSEGQGNIQATDRDGKTIRAAKGGKDADAGQDAPVQDGKAKAALKDRLEKMGITATDDQLNDPAFLKDVLNLLQAQAPSGDAETAAPEIGQDLSPSTPVAQNAVAYGDPTASAATTATATTATATATTTATVPTTDSAAPTADAPVVELPTTEKEASPQSVQEPAQKDLAALIKDRLTELAQTSKNPSADTGPSPAVAGNLRSGASAEPGSQAWRGMRLGRSEDTVSIDPMPTADLDRLRVMQAAALQASQAASQTSSQTGDKAAHADLDIAGSADAIDNSRDIGAVRVAAASDKSDTAQDGGADADSLGKDQSQSQGADFAMPKQGAQTVREGSAGPQFNQALDQTREADRKSPVERAWTPHQTAFDHGVIDQISKKMSAVTHLSGEEISIQLEPENLGKIRVGLGLKDGVMTAKIGVENEDVRKIVEANIANLRDTLLGQGIKLEGLEVSVDQRHSSLFNPDGSNSEAFFHRQGRGGEGSGKNAETAPIESAPESETGRRWGYNTMEYIA
jgi:flagellar hook-length control protein FliK